MYRLIVLACLVLVGCGDLPTSPSARATFTTDAGPGCHPAPNVPPFPKVFLAQATVGRDGFASWSVNGQTITATFKEIVPGLGMYGLCEWVSK